MERVDEKSEDEDASNAGAGSGKIILGLVSIT